MSSGYIARNSTETSSQQTCHGSVTRARSQSGGLAAFEPPPPPVANVAQLVERIHGKDEVSSSILDIGSKRKNPLRGFFLYTWN